MDAAVAAGGAGGHGERGRRQQVGVVDELPDGWTETSPTTADYEVTFDEVSCTPVAPIAPTVEVAACGDGVVVPSTITLSPTPGIVYTVDPLGPYDPFTDTTVTVVATLLDGYTWTPGFAPAGFRASAQPVRAALPPGWTATGPTTATYSVDLPALPQCPVGETPTTTDPTPTSTTSPAASSPSTPTTAVSGAGGETTTSTVSGTLPQTGSGGTGSAVAVAALLAGAGIALVTVARRRMT